MKEFWKKNKLWLGVVIYFIVVLAVIFVVIRPLVKKIYATADLIQEKRIDNEIEQARVAKIPEMQNAVQVYSAKEKDLDVLLKKGEEVDFIKKLEVLADITGNQINLNIIDSAGLGKNAKDSKVAGEEMKSLLSSDKYDVIQIELQGKYADLLNFINKLENFNYLVDLISVDLMKAEKEKEPQTGNLNPFAAPEKDKQAVPGEILKSTLIVVAYIRQ